MPPKIADPMKPIQHERRARVLFDETHSESWSIAREKAAQMSPDYPEYSSYQKAADSLDRLEFKTARHTLGPLNPSILATTDILALIHPCDPRWERTVGVGSPQLSDAEVLAIQHWVSAGGSLLVVTEFEHDKYGDNLNALLLPFGLHIGNGTVLDRTHCTHSNPAWIVGEPAHNALSDSLLIGVQQMCFYQAGPCSVDSRSSTSRPATSRSRPPRPRPFHAPLSSLSPLLERVVLFS